MKVLSYLGPKILSALKKRNQRRLRKLNDQVLKEAALEYNLIDFNLAVFSYVFSKIVSKPRYLKSQYNPWLNNIEKAFEKILREAPSKDEKLVMRLFSELEKKISALEDEDPRFILGLVKKGKLKMAATFYAQGMSLGVASDMTKLEKQEILDYAGQTMMFDRLKEEKSISERMKIARSFISG